MKFPIYLRLLITGALCLFFAGVNFAQRNSLEVKASGKAKYEHVAPKPQKPAASNKKRTAIGTVPADCNNDVIAPEIQCPGGPCLPNARAAYLVSSYGEPWGYGSNLTAMSEVFGPGNWDALYLESADVATLLSPAYKVIFLDGSNMGGYALNAFLTAHLPALEAWVAAGGALFLNCAPNEGYAPATINLGFGGVVLQNFIYITECIVQVPQHPVFNLPFSPANGPFIGSSFLHASVSGPAGLTLISDVSGAYIGLSEKNHGLGKVFFGSMTLPYFHDPQPNAQNMRQNILANLNDFCNPGVILPADAGECFATVSDFLLDATATDDCLLASLTHDFASAPADNSLYGAVFPVGTTLVTWTAIDAAGNTATCELVVLVRDAVAPLITCPENISVSADEGSCEKVADFLITATDNCMLAPVLASTPASGSTFPNGNTTVFASATDESGNTATCSFVVTVVPNPEICNGLDDDCNGLIDDGATGDNTFYADMDADGYGDPNNTETACVASPGFVSNALDCDDTNYYIQPGMYDYCNGVDDNCDGFIDGVWYADTDADGYGDPASFQTGCTPPDGYVDNNLDCDDTEWYIHPGMPEDCTNSIDENCDGILGDNNFTIAETHTDVYCGSTPDGSINLVISPAQNYPYIFWSNGLQNTPELVNLQDGTYKVTVTNECGTFKTKTIVILPPTEPALQINFTGTESICAGAANGTVTATVIDGCGDYTYEWNTGDTQASLSGLSGGTYIVTVTDACGCTQAGTFYIYEAYPLGIYTGAVIPLLDGTYFVEIIPYGGNPPYKFRRNILPDGFTNWSSSNGFLGVPSGEYVFEVEDNSGCTAQMELYLPSLSFSPASDAAAQLFTDNTNQETTRPGAVARQTFPETPGLAVSLFPNPNAGLFTVELPQAPTGTMLFYITDATGQVLMKKQAETGTERQNIAVEELPVGSYFLQIVLEGKVIAVEKFVKQL